MSSKISNFGAPISTHAWSADRKNVAISHNDQLVTLYKESGKPGKWDAISTLQKHTLRVTGKYKLYSYLKYMCCKCLNTVLVDIERRRSIYF